MKSGQWAALLLALFSVLFLARAANAARATSDNATVLRNVTIVNIERNRLPVDWQALRTIIDSFK